MNFRILAVLSLLFAATNAFAADSTEASKNMSTPVLDITPPKDQYFSLPMQVEGEGGIRTKIEPAGYSLTEINKYSIGKIIKDFDVAVVTQRTSLVYISNNNELEENKIFFRVLSIFSKLDSAEVTGGIPADVFDEKEPTYAIMRINANCVNKTLEFLSSEYFDKEDKTIKNLSTNIPQTAQKPNPKNIDGQLMTIACEMRDAELKRNPDAAKNKRVIEITPQGQTPALKK